MTIYFTYNTVNTTIKFDVSLTCIIDINNINNQLDTTVTVY